MTRFAIAGTNVYIMIEVSARVITSTAIGQINDMLKGAFRRIADYEADLGWTGLITGGMFRYGNGPQVAMWNANNHQLTIWTLQVALEAVFRYMRTTFDYGVAEFEIFDGANQVGKGYLITHSERRRDAHSHSAADADGAKELQRRAGDEAHRVNMGGTNRYILIGLTSQVFDHASIDNVYDMLRAAWLQTDVLGREYGADALVRGGVFAFGMFPVVRMWNANNHQLSYLALQQAIACVMRYMQANKVFGDADFSIFDGDNKVGEGVVGATG